jgi:hypothetical protein
MQQWVHNISYVRDYGDRLCETVNIEQGGQSMQLGCGQVETVLSQE